MRANGSQHGAAFSTGGLDDVVRLPGGAKHRRHFWPSDPPHARGFPDRFPRGRACDGPCLLGNQRPVLGARFGMAFGIVMGALAAVAGLIEFVTISRVRSLAAGWVHFLGNATAILLSVWNFLHRM